MPKDRKQYKRKPKYGRRFDYKNILWMMRVREVSPALMAAVMGLNVAQFVDRIEGGCGFDMRHMVRFCDYFQIDYDFIPRYFLQFEEAKT